MPTIVLITGANRGLGKGMLERFLSLPNHTIIAANRNPDHSTSKELSSVPKADGSKLIFIKLGATVWQDAFDAVKTIEAQSVDHLDIEKDLEIYLRPDVYGYVSLYQATRDLLKKSRREPVLANMGSTAGSLAAWLNSMALGSGWVHTELVDVGADAFHVDAETQAKLMIGLEEYCNGMFKVLGGTTKEKHGGKLVLYSGKATPW
ncbi:hypothetical protein PG994_010778 [Apiospora phragmitis]|uniref:NAD(P)-binding protein n=1 Tax=Apiospora phragmitis TaxID=2905665 RepID=A0ABR1TQX5_9PEZI